jgi:hypothetical protein
LHQEEKILFSLLKKEITATMMQSFPGIDPEISNWKGQEITDFQEELIKKINGQLSEKWFYTHMKGESESLPRIDVLNMLSQYAGYNSWQDFRYKKAGIIPGIKKPSNPLNILLKIPLLMIFAIFLLLIVIKIFINQNYRFTFIDSDTGQPLLNSEIRAELLVENESPISYNSDEAGNIVVRAKKSKIKMIVRAPYYTTDTITRVIGRFKHTEQISLKPDYYALMITHFSLSDVNSWEKRREQLNRILNEDAIIYQFPEGSSGNAMAIYNKWEFIDKITTPSSVLRQIEILDCRYLNGKIVILRFRIKKEIE